MLVLLILASAPATMAAGTPLPSGVAPPLAKAATDRELVWKRRCVAFEKQTALPAARCVFGDPGGSYTVALVGDSHLSHFFPAFDWLARRKGWRLVPLLKINCPFVDIRVRSLVLGREYFECATWNSRVVARINELKPDLVVVGMYVIRPVERAHRPVARRGAAVARMIQKLAARAVILADSPISRVDVPVCLSRNRHNIEACATPRRRALAGHAAVERSAARQASIPLIDLANDICVANPCPAVVNNSIVFRDTHHLTATFAESLGPPLERLIDAVR